MLTANAVSQRNSMTHIEECKSEFFSQNVCAALMACLKVSKTEREVMINEPI